jgi:hypothetical protein
MSDSLFPTYVVQPGARRFVAWTAKFGLPSTTVTGISMAVAALAAVWFASGDRQGMVVGALLLCTAYAIGHAGRLSADTTLAAWLAGVGAPIAEFTAYAGLAFGSTSAPAGSLAASGDVWTLAVAAVILQTVRDMTDDSYRSMHPEAPAGRSRLGQTLLLPTGDRFALIALTAAATNARVTFGVLLGWGGLALGWTLARRLAGRPATERP